MLRKYRYFFEASARKSAAAFCCGRFLAILALRFLNREHSNTPYGFSGQIATHAKCSVVRLRSVEFLYNWDI
jgi:hypothetical protein